MIKLTSLGDKEFYLNNELIYKMEEKPDTTIFLSDGKTIVVKENMEEVRNKIISYKREIYSKY